MSVNFLYYIVILFLYDLYLVRLQIWQGRGATVLVFAPGRYAFNLNKWRVTICEKENVGLLMIIYLFKLL